MATLATIISVVILGTTISILFELSMGSFYDYSPSPFERKQEKDDFLRVIKSFTSPIPHDVPLPQTPLGLCSGSLLERDLDVAGLEVVEMGPTAVVVGETSKEKERELDSFLLEIMKS